VDSAKNGAHKSAAALIYQDARVAALLDNILSDCF
jgi:hypothetical protein